jgi:hypothetical protein
MATAALNGVVVTVTVQVQKVSLTIDMSLQRHHYRFCGSGVAAVLNSLFFASVTDETVVAEGVEVGQQIENMLRAGAKYSALFGKQLTTKSGRTYLVDNSALDAKGWPNHFFVTGGTSVWGNMSMQQFVAASAIRRVEAAIDAKRALGDKTNYLDAKSLHSIRASAGIQNPVIAAFAAASTALTALPRADDQKMEAVSGRADLVALTRAW